MKRFAVIILTTAIGWSAVSFSCGPPVGAKGKTGKHPETQDPSDQNFSIGVQKYKDGDYDGAIDALLQSVEFARNMYKPTAYLWLGKAYMAKHEDTKALEACKHAAEQSLGGNPQAHLMEAEIYMRLGDDENTLKEINEGISEDDGPAYQGHNMMGKFLEKHNDLAGANMQFIDALGDPPWTYTDAWMNLAENFMKAKNWVSAISQLKGMLITTKKLPFDYPRIYLDIGICLLAKGDHQGAIDNWHTALTYDSNNADPHLQLGMLFDAENHISSAITEYKEFIRLSNDAHKVSRAKERIILLEQKINPAEADPEREKPSPYMRQQYQQQQQQKQQQQQQKQRQQQQQVPRDSGF